MTDYFLLAFRNLSRRGIRSWLTLLGIVIGIATVVSLIMLGNGLKGAVNAQFGVSSTQVITVQAGGLSGFGAPGTGVTNPITRDDAEAIEDLSEVEIAIPRNIETVTMVYRDTTHFGFAISVPEDKERLKKTYEILGIDIEKGKMLDEDDKGKIVLGNGYLDPAKSPFDTAIQPGKDIEINEKDFEVKGILERTGSFIFDYMVVILNDDLDDLTDYGEETDVIAVLVKDKDEMQRAKQEIEELMRDRRDVEIGQEDFQVETPEAALENVNNILGAIQAFLVIIASISIIVGIIGIVNTMTTSVLERTKQIGIMKAVGATNFQIFMQFLIESGMLGFVGGLIGAGLGTGIGFLGTFAINSFIGTETTCSIDFILIGGALAGSFIIGAIAGIVPALNAAKKDPVESLRG